MGTGLAPQGESWGGTRLNYNLGLNVTKANILQIIASLAYDRATCNYMFQNLPPLVHPSPPTLALTASFCVAASYPNR